jgi:hypothetical protein
VYDVARNSLEQRVAELERADDSERAGRSNFDRAILVALIASIGTSAGSVLAALIH